MAAVVALAVVAGGVSVVTAREDDCTPADPPVAAPDVWDVVTQGGDGADGTRRLDVVAPAHTSLVELWCADDVGEGGFATADGLVWVAPRFREELRAIDARTGRDVWTVDLEEIGGWSVVAGPVLAGDLVVVALDSGHLLAVEQATGLDRWSWSSQTYSISDIVAVDDRVYVTTRTGDGVAVVALDGSGGTQRWRTDLGDVDGAFSAQVSATPSAVLVGVEGTDRAVMFGVATDGRLGWELDLGDTHLTGRPAIDGATAVLATQDDDAVVSIIGLPVATGEETWRWTRRPETGTTYQTPVRALAVSGEWVYAAGPELLLLDRATGEVSGTLPGYSAVPFVVGDELVGCPVRAALGRTADTRTVHMSDEDGDAVSCYDLVTVANGAYYAVDDGDLRALG